MTTIAALSVQELVRFLLARIDEDDEELRRRQRRHDAINIGEDVLGSGVGSFDRQRAECDAKRRIIGHAQHLFMLRDLPAEKVVRDSAERVLRAMASPYRDHYAFREEWEVTR